MLNMNESEDVEQGRWSSRAIAIGTILEPFRDKQPSPKDFEKLRNQLIPLYKGRRVTVQTVRNLLHAFRDEGLDGLERSSHRDKGNSTLPPLVVQYIQDMLKTQRHSKKYILQKAQDYARDTLELTDLEISYAQILFIDKFIDPKDKILGQDGVGAYRDGSELVEQFEAEFANDLWPGDNHRLDIFVIDPATGKKFRPWISTFLDDHSRAIPGFYLSRRDPGSRGIALAFRHAMLLKATDTWIVRGIPNNVYFDHGKDYLSEHIRLVCMHLGIHIMNHEKYHPRAKGKLERWFRTLEEDCLSKEDGYVGSKPKKRQKNLTVSHTMESLYSVIENWIVNVYHKRVHSETKVSPHARWLASSMQRRIRFVDTATERELDFLLNSRRRVVSNIGIRHNNLHYRDKDYVIEKYIGESVTVYFDPLDSKQIQVYKPDDDTGTLIYICTAHPYSKRVMDDDDRRIVAEEQKKRRQQRVESVRDSKKRVEAVENSEKKRRSNSDGVSKKGEAVKSKDVIDSSPTFTSAVEDVHPPVRRRRITDILKEYENGEE